MQVSILPSEGILGWTWSWRSKICFLGGPAERSVVALPDKLKGCQAACAFA